MWPMAKDCRFKKGMEYRFGIGSCAALASGLMLEADTGYRLVEGETAPRPLPGFRPGTVHHCEGTAQP